jgi:hypothetical protein
MVTGCVVRRKIGKGLGEPLQPPIEPLGIIVDIRKRGRPGRLRVFQPMLERHRLKKVKVVKSHVNPGLMVRAQGTGQALVFDSDHFHESVAGGQSRCRRLLLDPLRDIPVRSLFEAAAMRFFDDGIMLVQAAVGR